MKPQGRVGSGDGDARFRSTFERAAVAMAHVDLEGSWLRVNQRFCALAGCARDELVGSPVTSLLDPDDLAPERASLEALRDGALEHLEIQTRLRRRTGPPLWVVAKMSLQRDAADRPSYGLVVLEDVHTLREKEERLRILAAVVENSNDFVGICDLDLVPIYLNEAGWRMVGFDSLDAALKQPVLEYFWPEDRQRIESEALPAVRREGRWVGEVRFRSFATGAPIHTQWSVFTIEDDAGQPVALATVSPNLDRQKRTEEALRETTRKLERANREKDRFLSSLGHELRNPLGALLHAVEVLQAPPDPETDRRMREAIGRQAGQLAALVDDMVDLVRVQRSRLALQRQPTDLASWLRENVRDQRLEAEQRRLQLLLDVPEAPVPVSLDATRMAQVLGNLLANAFRATPVGGRVSVALTAEDGRATIRVSDTGRGIAAPDLERIFEPFERVRTAPEAGGLGLGLPIAREIVKRHGGTLTATSGGEGRGAAFLVVLPLGVAAPREPTPEPPRSDRRHRIVLIEDHRDAADSLALLLRARGHEVHVAYDGPEGIDRVRAVAPDAVVSDIGLPGMDGYGVARVLRSEWPADAFLLVGLTGYVHSGARAAAEAAGFDAHLPKPVQIHQLEALLDRGPLRGRIDPA